MDAAHQAATLTIEIGVYLFLEGGLVQIATAHGNTESNSLLLSLASDILVHSNGRVDTTALTEEGSDSSARSLRRDKDDIDIGWNLDFGKILEYWGKTMREIQRLQRLVYISRNGCCTCLALGQLRLDRWPGFTLSSIAEQVHDDSAFADSIINLEQVLSWNPAIPEYYLAFIYTIAGRFHTVQHLSMIVHSS